MIPSQTAEDRLRRAFAPTQGGIVGLTDQLLEACVGSDLEFKRVGNRCVCNWIVNGETKEVPVPLPAAAFRTILARIAVLCNEYSPNAVTPYGGEGLLTVKGLAPTVVRVAFVNTPDEQRLEVRRNAEGIPRPPLHGVPDAMLRPAIEPLASVVSASGDPLWALSHVSESLLAELADNDQEAVKEIKEEEPNSETRRH